MLLGVLLLLAHGWAADGLRLPPGEDPALWAPLLVDTGLELVGEDPRVDIQAGHRLWRVVLTDGSASEVMIAPARTEETRRDLIVLVESLLEPVPVLDWPEASRLPSLPEPPPPEPEPVTVVSTSRVPPAVVSTSRPSPRVQPPSPPPPPLEEAPVAEPPPAPPPPPPTEATVATEELPTEEGVSPWLQVAPSASWAGGTGPSARLHLLAGLPLTPWLSVAAGGVGTTPSHLDVERDWLEVGGMAGARASQGLVGAFLGLELTSRRFRYGGELVEEGAKAVPAALLDLHLDLLPHRRADLGLLLGARLDLRPVDTYLGEDLEQTLPPWGVHAGLAVGLDPRDS